MRGKRSVSRFLKAWQKRTAWFDFHAVRSRFHPKAVIYFSGISNPPMVTETISSTGSGAEKVKM